MDNALFKSMVWQIVASIPKGKVATYGQIAKMAGFPNHARFVGRVLSGLPAESTLPWHRVVNAKRQISFPYQSDAYNKQRHLLELDGVVFSNSNKIVKNYLLAL